MTHIRRVLRIFTTPSHRRHISTAEASAVLATLNALPDQLAAILERELRGER